MNNGDLEHLRQEMVNASNVLYKLNIVDMYGHISVKLDDNTMLMKPRPVSWIKLGPQDLLLMDMNGDRLDGVKQHRHVAREWPLHSETYALRPEVRCVMHCHPRYSVQMASLGIEMEPIDRDAMLFPGGVPTYAGRECLVDRQTMVDTRPLGREVAEALGPHRALILTHHGVLIAGETIGHVVHTIYHLERAARAHLVAASIQKPPFMDPGLRHDIEETWRNDTFFGLQMHDLMEERWSLMKSDLLERD